MKIVFVLLLMILTLTVEFYPQKTDKVQKGEKTLVSVPVTVSDREGRYISGLKKEDFTLYQDGVKQNIGFFATEDEPVSVALLLDTSASTKDVLDKIKDAAKDFIALMNPNDQCLVATFDSKVNILSPFTSDRQPLKESLEKIQTATGEGTVIFSAVRQITQSFSANSAGRKVIVILSDGKDYGSTISKTELFSQLEESDILIYSVFYQTGKGFNKPVLDASGTIKEGEPDQKPKKEKKPKKKKGYSIQISVLQDIYTQEDIKLGDRVATIEAVNALQEMSDLTAGRFYLSDAPNLGRIFKQIAGELRQQYRLGYYSKDGANEAAIRNISVTVIRPDVVVRTRGKFRPKQL
ncbi:MAG: VWA domain-containing protein [Actinomycetota bacterium]